MYAERLEKFWIENEGKAKFQGKLKTVLLLNAFRKSEKKDEDEESEEEENLRRKTWTFPIVDEAFLQTYFKVCFDFAPSYFNQEMEQLRFTFNRDAINYSDITREMREPIKFILISYQHFQEHGYVTGMITFKKRVTKTRVLKYFSHYSLEVSCEKNKYYKLTDLLELGGLEDLYFNYGIPPHHL